MPRITTSGDFFKFDAITRRLKFKIPWEMGTMTLNQTGILSAHKFSPELLRLIRFKRKKQSNVLTME